MALETETKFAVDELAAVRERLLTAGAELVQARVLEINLRLDNAAGDYRLLGKVLRLRQDSRARLTLKLPAGLWGTRAKTLRELEIEVSDLETAQEILAELGFKPWFTYEKYRESYQLAGAEVSLDQLPFGIFVEIEGSHQQIDEVAERLHLTDKPRITAGYASLFYQAKQCLKLPFDDCTFANWESYVEAR